MEKPIRILQIVNIMDRAGLETMLMNYYRAINRSCIQFDFLTHRPLAGAYDEEIRALGGRIFRAPRLYPQNCIAYRRYVRAFFAAHRYPVVHSHIDAMSVFPLAMARDCRVAVRVAHSHSDSIDRDLRYPIKQIARHRLPKVATHYWACSEAAGAFLFGEGNMSRVRVVKNAINLERFRFNVKVRDRVRRELGISDRQVVLGHVGRFSAVKNHDLLIDLAAELEAEGADFVLILVGDGELRSVEEKKAGAAGLSENVRFFGMRDDVADLVQAFDLMVFPSLHEGIPLTLIEAQASGLPVLTSDRVSAEALVLSNTSQISLNAPISAWAQEALHLARFGRADNSIEALVSAGYEIHSSADSLTDEYLRLYSEAE